MFTIGSSESVLAFIGSVVRLRGEQRLIVTLLELHGVSTGKGRRLNHLFRGIEVSLMVCPNFCHNIGR